MDVLRDFPGLPGLFVAGVVSAALRYNLVSCHKDSIKLFKGNITKPINATE